MGKKPKEKQRTNYNLKYTGSCSSDRAFPADYLERGLRRTEDFEVQADGSYKVTADPDTTIRLLRDHESDGVEVIGDVPKGLLTMIRGAGLNKILLSSRRLQDGGR